MPSSPVDSNQLSAPYSPTQSESSDDNSIQNDPFIPRATATKRDKLVGKAERVLSKVIRDPELNERAALRATGGKELADGMAFIDPKNM